jgi:NAD(P)-dependent dehydrogenase (short-subunit alcohol dehydrogenase family)
VLGARRVALCEEIAYQIRAEGGDAAAFHLDLESPESIDEFAGAASGAFGEIEIFVSNAGRSVPGRAYDSDPVEFASTVAVNLFGAQRLAGRLVAPMVERARGDVVFVTSETVRAPRPGAAAYVVSKWGLEGLARSMQMELEGTGVRATIVRPGQTLTEMGSDWDQETTTAVIDSWIHWGLARHNGFLRPDGVALAVLSAISVARGTHISLIEVEPEAPISSPHTGEEHPTRGDST